MTLRALQTAGVLDINGCASAAPTGPTTALAFALDAAYLIPFKVFLYSMALVGAFADCPIHVYSDDPELFNDPVVAKAADRAVLLPDPLQRKLQRLARTQVKRPERADWNRGTFLKWAVFEQADVDQVLFLDVDMLCLRDPAGLISLPEGVDIAACPQFQPKMLAGTEGPVSRDEAYARLTLFCDGKSPQFSQRLNSGVMLIGKRLLSENARRQMIKDAKTRVLINEQSHLTAFFNENKYKLEMNSPILNFQESYLRAVSAADARALLRRIAILHYAGEAKPWKADPAVDMRDSQRLWWSHREAAGLSSGLFGR